MGKRCLLSSSVVSGNHRTPKRAASVRISTLVGLSCKFCQQNQSIDVQHHFDSAIPSPALPLDVLPNIPQSLIQQMIVMDSGFLGGAMTPKMGAQ